ncbi:DUF1553 domain-containing protein, partial [Akkermansiaceae bacterium]|nr:DUF1553 domain-containing protein [Akkermansiaceae bacterium]
LPVYRSSGYDGQKAFDTADPAVSNGNRRTSTVAGQALYLMNSELMHTSSKALADFVISKSPENRPAWMIKHVFGRDPTKDESARGITFVESYGDEKGALAAFARVLLSSNEFLYME